MISIILVMIGGGFAPMLEVPLLIILIINLLQSYLSQH
ncbi:Uncharacterised protein [Staphylococcus aureus]|nr:Uncharacterised protein [Staphylococcus aureus]